VDSCLSHMTGSDIIGTTPQNSLTDRPEDPTAKSIRRMAGKLVFHFSSYQLGDYSILRGCDDLTRKAG
jgi:hypothetical protein